MSTPTRDELDKSYKKTMAAMQSELHNFDRLLSHLLHANFMSFLLLALSKTIFSLRAMLVGSTASFLAIVFFYLYAKIEGYTTTGFEPIIAFLVGWILGLMIDIFSKK